MKKPALPKLSNLPRLPIFSTPDRPLKAGTQDHIPIADITQDIVVYKDGGAAIVLESSALNFGLLSEKEKEAVIAAYAALINSLSFSIQIVIRSKRKNIANYMRYLEQAYQKTENPLLKNLIADYKVFISETIKKKNVLEKKFYIVLPLSPYELGLSKSFGSATRRKGPLPFPESYVIKKAKLTLFPRRDHLRRQTGRLGLKIRQLKTSEMIELYYNIYNEKYTAGDIKTAGQPTN